MTAVPVPEYWRPVITLDHGHQVVGFRGHEIRSVVGEFTDADAMLGEAAVAGVTHLLLSPWINLVPVEAGPHEAPLACPGQKDAPARAAPPPPGPRTPPGAGPP